MDRRSIAVLSHASDIDGVGSSALIKAKYGIPASMLFFADYSKQSLGYVDSKLAGIYKNGIVLFITDLGVNDSLIAAYRKILLAVKKGGGKVVWFDHHPWSDRAVKELASLCDTAVIGENEKYCATEITYKELGMAGGFYRDFVRLVHYSDFNITPRSRAVYGRIGVYALGITSYGILQSRDAMTMKLRHVAEVISKGRYYDSKIKADALRFERLNRDRISKMLKEMLLYPHAAIGFSSHVQSTAGCTALMKRSGKEIGIYVNTSNMRGHIRCEDKDISVLAGALGGGGHPHASGFNVPRQFKKLDTSAERKRLADFLGEKIEELGI